MPMSKPALLGFVSKQPDSSTFRVDNEGRLFVEDGDEIVDCIPETLKESLRWTDDEEESDGS